MTLIFFTALSAVNFLGIYMDNPVNGMFHHYFILFNVLVTGALGLIAYVNWDWVAGLIWFMLKAFAFVFVFVWMRGTFPRVRIDQLMGFAWKWLLPAAMLNLFVTALAIILIDSLHKSGVIR